MRLELTAIGVYDITFLKFSTSRTNVFKYDGNVNIIDAIALLQIILYPE